MDQQVSTDYREVANIYVSRYAAYTEKLCRKQETTRDPSDFTLTLVFSALFR